GAPHPPPPAQLVVKADQEERHDRDDRDRLVLAPKVRGCTLLNGLRDLLHALVSGRQVQQPERERDAVRDGGASTEEREQDCVISEEAQVSCPLRSRRRELPARRVSNTPRGFVTE